MKTDGTLIGVFDASRGVPNLRDYFAAKAMQAIITSPYYVPNREMDADLILANRAYTIADTMLAERERVEGK